MQRWPLTLGRALGNDVVLDDPHVAAYHATLSPDAQGQLTLTVGDTVNGVSVGNRHFAAGARVPLEPGGAALQIGAVSEALLRLKESRYGGCADCGAQIPFERLQAEPWALRCLACEALHEVRSERLRSPNRI